MRNLKNNLYVGALLLSIFFWSQASIALANHSNAIYNDFKPGVWQTIVDGQSGEGSMFYRLTFNETGTVEIIKQAGGSDNIVEEKMWYQNGTSIIISSKSDDIIKEFDGELLFIKDKNTLSYKNNKYQSIIKPYKHSYAIIHWILILVVLIILNELFRRKKWSALIFFILIPLILTPLVWSQQGVSYWFKWVKIYSVVFAAIWFTLIRFTKFGKFNWVKLVAALFLAVNIAEAVSQDFSMGFLPNVLNGIAGVLNIITLFYGWKQIGPDNSKHKDMVWPKMTIFWIIAYDIWNIVYVYLNFPGSTSAQFMVILACTIPALFIKKGTWLQARAFTLGVWFMYYFTFPRFTEQMELLVPRSYNLMLFVATISIAVNVIYFFIFVRRIYQEKNNKELNQQIT